MLKGIKNHCIPTTSSNVYWKQWDQVSQVEHGKVQRIGITAIEIDRIAEQLQGKIPDIIKLQKFLDVIHPVLRHAMESGINKDKFDWEEILALAERHDDSLFQAGKYGKHGGGSKKIETFAITQHNQQRTINLKKGQKKTTKHPPRTGNPQLYHQRKQEKLSYFYGKKGHMIADCCQRKEKEPETGICLHSTEILLEDGQSFDEFLESLNITYEPPAHMTARLKVGGKLVKILLDTGSVGTNLMSLNWAHSNRNKTMKMDTPVEISMATKNFRTTANYSAKEDIDIGNGKRISSKFLLVPVGSYDVIHGMPFMIKTDATLRTGKGTLTFGNSQTTISCAPTEPITMAAPITIIDCHEGSLSLLDDNDEYHDLFRQDKDSERLQHIDLIRRMATAAIETLQEPHWDKEVHNYARQMIVYAARAYKKQIPNFRDEFPSVFLEKIPVTLPPLRKGLNHKITLKESELGNNRNEYSPIPESKMKQLSK